MTPKFVFNSNVISHQRSWIKLTKKDFRRQNKYYYLKVQDFTILNPLQYASFVIVASWWSINLDSVLHTNHHSCTIMQFKPEFISCMCYYQCARANIITKILILFNTLRLTSSLPLINSGKLQISGRTESPRLYLHRAKPLREFDNQSIQLKWSWISNACSVYHSHLF